MIENLMKRSGEKCELCGNGDELAVFEIPNSPDGIEDTSLLACGVCLPQLKGEQDIIENHWHCLNECMWSEHISIQIVSYRMLFKLKNVTWAQDLLEQMYLEEDNLNWAKAGVEDENALDLVTKDSLGNILNTGDTVTLIKDLNVKGGGFTAKRGTVVKGIRLTDNPIHIEGKVNGVRIVLVTDYLKKV